MKPTPYLFCSILLWRSFGVRSYLVPFFVVDNCVPHISGRVFRSVDDPSFGPSLNLREGPSPSPGEGKGHGTTTCPCLLFPVSFSPPSPKREKRLMRNICFRGQQQWWQSLFKQVTGWDHLGRPWEHENCIVTSLSFRMGEPRKDSSFLGHNSIILTPHTLFPGLFFVLFASRLCSSSCTIILI